MRFIFLALIVILTAVVFLSLMSQRGQAKGLVDGRLAPLSSKPNCVSSEEGTDPAKKVEPLTADKAAIKAAVEATGGKVTSETDTYISATYTSGIMRYVDDVEFRQDGEVWQVRSASRVGYSDMGANRKRVSAIRAALP
ncbi:MAG: DUF1499 domain-containing protein [Pseudomonadota bacterium]